MSDHLAELTPRERETFELLRLGLTNEEIAERLGITLDGAKYHVSQILSKLGVSSRENAATISTPPVRNRSWQVWPLGLKIVALVLSGALVAGVVVLGFGVLRTNGSDDDAGGAGSSISLTLTSDDPLSVAAYHNTSTRPSISQDHWHAAYAIYVGEQRQPNAPTWESGVHTHGDGLIHIHPFQSFEEGAGASLDKWFQYGGGELTDATVREPGYPTTYHNGDPVPGDGRPGQVYVILGGTSGAATDGLDLSGQWIRVPPSYRPQDGDQIRILFEPEDVMRAHVKNPPSAITVSQSPIPSVVCEDIQAGLQTFQVCTTATATAAANVTPR